MQRRRDHETPQSSGGRSRPVRAPVLLAALLVLPFAAAGDFEPQARRFVGSTTRAPPLGPVVVCDAEGNGFGGACFESPFTSGYVTILVHDDRLPDWVPMPVTMASYGADVVPLPIDVSYACAPNHAAMTFWFQRYTTRIEVAVGPWAGSGGVQWPGPTCAGMPATQGTIEMRPYPGT